jgi:hypothetical protein
MSTVWMRHPDLPQDQLIQVSESSAPHHQAAGWEITDPPTPPARPAPRTAAEAPAADATEDPAPEGEAAPAPRRRKTTPKAEES